MIGSNCCFMFLLVYAVYDISGSRTNLCFATGASSALIQVLKSMFNDTAIMDSTNTPTKSASLCIAILSIAASLILRSICIGIPVVLHKQTPESLIEATFMYGCGLDRGRIATNGIE